MATTPRQLITGSMRLLNYITANEVPSALDMNIAISAFDAMIDSWSADRLMIYEINPYIFNTVAGQQDYLSGPGSNLLTFSTLVGGAGYVPGSYVGIPMTGGSGQLATCTVTVNPTGNVSLVQVFINNQMDVVPGYGYKVSDVLTTTNNNLGGTGAGFSITVASVSAGDWNIVRPMRIEQAYVIWSNTTQTTDIPMSLLNNSQYASIPVKSTPSTFPFALYDNGAYPLRKVSIWPIPTVATPLRLWLREPLVDLTQLDQIVQYPPGYERAFRFCLAVELAAEFGKTIDPVIQGTAIKAKEEIASFNADPQYSVGDGGLTRNRQPFSYITGGFLGTRF